MKRSGLFLLLISLTTSPAFSQDPKALLLRVRENVQATLSRIPKYLCTQTVDRSRYEPDRLRDLPLCGEDRENGNPSKQHLASSDRLRLDVAVVSKTEIYSWVGENSFGKHSLFELTDGVLSTGTFLSFLKIVFLDDNADFSYMGESAVDGRSLAEFNFEVPAQNSHYRFGDGIRHWTMAYQGSATVDPGTGELAKLVVHIPHLPSESGACEATTTLQYHQTRMNNAEFLLPAETTLQIIDANGSSSVNRTAYTSCHQYLGESTLSFDDPLPTSGKPAQAAAPPDIPEGLPFSVVTTHDIDPATAAAGDAFFAKLDNPIRDRAGNVFVPKGAKVIGRLMRAEKTYKPDVSFTLVVKLETVEVLGKPVPLFAQPDQARNTLSNKRAASLHPQGQRLGQIGSLGKPEGLAVFRYTGLRTDRVIRGEMRSTWVTQHRP